MPPREGGAGWGHLAGAWELDDFTGLSKARKPPNPSGAGGWGTAARDGCPPGSRPAAVGGREGGGGGLGRGRPRALCDLGPVSLPSHSGRETYRSVRSWGVQMEKPRPDPQGLWRPRGGPDTRPRSGWGPNTVCNFSACRAREDKGLGANGGTGGGLWLPLLRTPSCPPGPPP